MEIAALNFVWQIIKSPGIWPMAYSASNVDVPDGLEDNVKRRLFQFLWKSKRQNKKQKRKTRITIMVVCVCWKLKQWL